MNMTKPPLKSHKSAVHVTLNSSTFQEMDDYAWLRIFFILMMILLALIIYFAIKFFCIEDSTGYGYQSILKSRKGGIQQQAKTHLLVEEVDDLSSDDSDGSIPIFSSKNNHQQKS